MLPGLFSKVVKLAGDNQSTILTGIGVTGVVSTAYFSGRASFKAAELIERENLRRIDTAMTDDPKPAMSKKEKVKLVWPLYIPPVTVAATTITAIVMANHEASKKIAALTVASGISERALQEYKEKIYEKLGERKAVEFHDEIAQDRVNRNPPPGKGNTQVILSGKGEVLFMDSLTGRYFLSSMEEVRRAENKINFEILNHMYASLSAFYQEIGLDPTPYSETVGWNGNELFEVTFSTAMTPDSKPCIVIDFARLPFTEYDRMW